MYGRTVNVSARLSAASGEGEVVVSDPATRQLGDEITLEDLGSLDLKGLAELLQTYRVVGQVLSDPVS